MNEQLKELAEQAFKGLGTNPVYATAMIYASKELEKFAELIVRDAVNQCRQEWYDTNNDPELNAETDPRMIGIKIGIKQGAMRCISRINKHFGIKE